MNLAAFNLFLGVMSLIALICFCRSLLRESRIRNLPHVFVGSGYFKQAGLDTDGSSGLPRDVRDVDVFGTPL